MRHIKCLFFSMVLLTFAGGLLTFSHQWLERAEGAPVPVQPLYQAVEPTDLAPKTPRSEPVSVQKKRLVKPNPVVVNSIRYYNEALSYAEAAELARLIQAKSKKYNVDPLLVTALVSQESAFRADAVSPVGAIGLGQLMPFTAKDLGVDPWDPAENLDGCVRYLSQNIERWRHSKIPVALALASYNAGPGAVGYYGGIPPYDETRHYVRAIRERYQNLRSRHLAFRQSQKEARSS